VTLPPVFAPLFTVPVRDAVPFPAPGFASSAPEPPSDFEPPSEDPGDCDESEDFDDSEDEEPWADEPFAELSPPQAVSERAAATVTAARAVIRVCFTVFPQQERGACGLKYLYPAPSYSQSSDTSPFCHRSTGLTRRVHDADRADDLDSYRQDLRRRSMRRMLPPVHEDAVLIEVVRITDPMRHLSSDDLTGKEVAIWEPPQTQHILTLIGELPGAERFRCFIPGWGIRVHSATEHLFQMAFCFRCNGVRLWGPCVPAGREGIHTFDPASPAGQELLELFRTARPGPFKGLFRRK
jgi:hypothetical protein